MNKIWLIFQREYLNRVQKKSFLIVTILVPLIFPAIMGIMVYAFIKQEEGAVAQVIEVYDESGKIKLEDDTRNKFIRVSGNFDSVKSKFNESSHFAILRIPSFELNHPDGIRLYTKESPTIRKVEELEHILENKIHDLKLLESNIDQKTLDNLKTDVTIGKIPSLEQVEKESNISVLSGLGFVLGILIYMFVMIYGMQIMLSVLDEKANKVVEVIISSVKPFQLMMGKIVGIAAVGLTQFAIWIILITVLALSTFAIFGVSMPQQQAMEQITNMQDPAAKNALEAQSVAKIQAALDEIPVVYVVFNFVFYFLGGYLLYGALFAAVGSAVDNQQEAQQFTLPVMLPLLISYFALFLFILTDPHSTASFWFSIIPFTSPIAMVGRLGFNPPLWQLILSQVLLIVGFIFTTWVASRIYRIGILMHGSKVNFKVLAKWFMMKS